MLFYTPLVIPTPAAREPACSNRVLQDNSGLCAVPLWLTLTSCAWTIESPWCCGHGEGLRTLLNPWGSKCGPLMLLGPIRGTGSWVDGRHLVDEDGRPVGIKLMNRVQLF